MRTCLLIAALAVCGPAAAQDAEFKNPTPVNFNEPFLYDGVQVRSEPFHEDVALPVEVIGRDELIERFGPADAASRDDKVRRLREAPGAEPQAPSQLQRRPEQ